MHKYNSLFFLVLLFLVACGDGSSDGIIPQDKMASLLTEIHIIDGSLYTTTQAPDSLYKYGTAKYNAAFKRYHTDSVQFNKSYKYYTTDPIALKAIYRQVVINLQFKTDSLNHNKHPTNVTPDI